MGLRERKSNNVPEMVVTKGRENQIERKEERESWVKVGDVSNKIKPT